MVFGKAGTVMGADTRRLMYCQVSDAFTFLSLTGFNLPNFFFLPLSCEGEPEWLSLLVFLLALPGIGSACAIAYSGSAAPGSSLIVGDIGAWLV